MTVRNESVRNRSTQMDREDSHAVLGAVIIGRNEGVRLQACLESVGDAAYIVYVDSGSNDSSLDIANAAGATVVELDPSVPFTAARARNAGFGRLVSLGPTMTFVQFVDADTVLSRDWMRHASTFLSSNPQVAVVSGRLREKNPSASVYNWLCDREWDGPEGEARACGGIAMMRAEAFQAIDGFRDGLIAGEEPELCVRLRAAGWSIWRLPHEMGFHDAAMTRFAQWFRRATRGGYAFAQGAHLHGRSPERHWVWETRRAWLWGLAIPLISAAALPVVGLWGLLILLVYPLQILRQTYRNTGALRDRFTLALFQMLARFAEVAGQLKFLKDRLLRRQPLLIEYK